MDKPEQGLDAVNCGCSEFPECTHSLYWYQGFKAGAASRAPQAGEQPQLKSIAEDWLNDHKHTWSAHDLFTLIRLLKHEPAQPGDDPHTKGYQEGWAAASKRMHDELAGESAGLREQVLSEAAGYLIGLIENRPDLKQFLTAAAKVVAKLGDDRALATQPKRIAKQEPDAG